MIAKNASIASRLLRQWHTEDDPISREQADTLLSMLGETELTEAAFEGFLIIAGRLVDDVGNHRTASLSQVFCTGSAAGRRAMLRSFEYFQRLTGGMEGYERRYPVTIIPAQPAYPLLKIRGIERLIPHVYRVLDSKRTIPGTREGVSRYIARTGHLPSLRKQRHPVVRQKPHMHWCSYGKWSTPSQTAEALQIEPHWNNCELRATISTRRIRNSAYLAFSGDPLSQRLERLKFNQYFYEVLTQDGSFAGGGIQVAVDGKPAVQCLEQWDGPSKAWKIVWCR